ncbi:MAG: LysR family transcriptional regulator [Lachnospiraceae bacterium]
MNFLNLKYFLVAAEELNITRASERLHISQQALSNHITKLEKELDTELFSRVPTLSLTYSGKCLVQSGSQILDLQHQFLTEIEDINGNCRGELAIGISHTRGQAILPLLLPQFMQTHPFINIRIEEGNSRDLEESLQHGFIDLLLGFMPFRLESAVITKLSKERLFLVVPKAFMNTIYGEKANEIRAKYASGADISAFQSMPFVLLKKGDRVRTIMDDYFKKRTITPIIALETENIQTAFALATEGVGIAVYPEMFLRGVHTLSSLSAVGKIGETDFFPLQSASTIETLAIGYNRDRYLSKAAIEFIELSKELLI